MDKEQFSQHESPDTNPQLELEKINGQIAETVALYQSLLERKKVLETELGITEEAIQAYRIHGGAKLLEQNNLYCDRSELEKIEDKIEQHHRQSLDELSARGGLGIHEIYSLFTDIPASKTAQMDQEQLVQHLVQMGVFKEKQPHNN